METIYIRQFPLITTPRIHLTLSLSRAFQPQRAFLRRKDCAKQTTIQTQRPAQNILLPSRHGDHQSNLLAPDHGGWDGDHTPGSAPSGRDHPLSPQGDTLTETEAAITQSVTNSPPPQPGPDPGDGTPFARQGSNECQCTRKALGGICGYGSAELPNGQESKGWQSWPS